jgi:hypothetical protein
MVDLPKRVDIEGAFAKALGKVFSGTFKELMKLLGDPPDLNNLTPEWWVGVEKATSAAIRPVLEEAFMGAVDAMAGDVGYVVDWELANTTAQGWAAVYTDDFVEQIWGTRRGKVSTAVMNFFDKGGSMGQLRKDIGRWFSPGVAELIAQTEVTRAATAGELWQASDLQAQGVTLRAVIQTSNDDLVCPVCGPLNGQDANGRFPPFHVGCRCWVNHEVVTE